MGETPTVRRVDVLVHSPQRLLRHPRGRRRRISPACESSAGADEAPRERACPGQPTRRTCAESEAGDTAWLVDCHVSEIRSVQLSQGGLVVSMAQLSQLIPPGPRGSPRPHASLDTALPSAFSGAFRAREQLKAIGKTASREPPDTAVSSADPSTLVIGGPPHFVAQKIRFSSQSRA